MKPHVLNHQDFSSPCRKPGFSPSAFQALLMVACALVAGSAYAEGDYNSAEHPGEAKGYQESSYDLSKYESINLANGNLTFRVPLYTLSTAGGLSYDLSLVHNDKQAVEFPTCKHYDPEPPGDCEILGPVAVPGGMRVYGYTWDLRPPRIVLARPVPDGVYPWSAASSLTGVPHWIDESGAVHNLIGLPAWEHDGEEQPCNFDETDVCFTTANHRVTASRQADGTIAGFSVEDPNGTVYRIDLNIELGMTTFDDHYFKLDIPGWYTTAIERGPWTAGQPNNRIEFRYCGGNVSNPCDSDWSEPWLLREVTATAEAGSFRTVVLNYDDTGLCEEELCHTFLDSITVPSFNPALGVEAIDSSIVTTIDLAYDVDLLRLSFGGPDVFTPRLESISFLTSNSPPEGPTFSFNFVDPTTGLENLTFDTVDLPSGAHIQYSWMIDLYRLGTKSPSKFTGDPVLKPNTADEAMQCEINTPGRPVTESSAEVTKGLFERTTTFLDSLGDSHSETTRFFSFKNCAQSDSDPDKRLDWPYDFSSLLRFNNADYEDGGFIRYYLWTLVQTFDSTDPDADDLVFQTEIHRFNPVTYDEFSVDYLEPSTTDIAELASQDTIFRDVEDFALWGNPVRLRHTEIEKRGWADLGDLFPGKDRADPTYEFVAASRVLAFVDSSGNLAPSCYPTVPDPEYPPGHTCMVVSDTVHKDNVDPFLNVLSRHISTANAPTGTESDRTGEATYRPADPTVAWRGFNLVESTTKCDGVGGSSCDCATTSCTRSGQVWKAVDDSGYPLGYYRLTTRFTNPSGADASTFECSISTAGGCTRQDFVYDDEVGNYGNCIEEQTQGGFNAAVSPEPLAVTTHIDFRHGKPMRKWLEDETNGTTLLLWQREIDPNTGLPRWHLNGSGVGSAYLFDGLGRVTDIAPIRGVFASSSGGLSELNIDTLTIDTYVDDDGTARKLIGSSITYLLPTSSALMENEVSDSINQNISIPGGLSAGSEGVTRNRFLFDGRGRPSGWVESYVDSTGASSFRSRASVDMFDAEGRVQKASEWVAGANPASAANWTVTRLDGLGRPTSIQAPDGSVVTASYIGDSASTTARSVACNDSGADCEFQTTTLTDGLGRVVEVVEQHDPDNPASDPVVSSYTYDQSDRLVTAVIKKSDGSDGQTRDFEYNAGGFLVESTEPERTITFQAYDALGNVLEDAIEDSPANLERCYVYDDFGRVEWRLIGACTGVAPDENTPKYAYFVYGDAKTDPHSIGSPGYNRLFSATEDNHYANGDVVVTHEWEYAGPGGSVSKRSTSLGGIGSPGDTFDVAYGYDAWGNVRVTHHPMWSADPEPCTKDVRSYHQYNGAWLSRSDVTIDDPTIPKIGISLAYHPSGRRSRVDYFNGSTNMAYISETVDPDGMARPSSIHWGWGDPPANFATEGPYQYDGSGNITSIGTDPDPDAKHYYYDGLNRVREFQLGAVMSESYDYDRWGNLTNLIRYGNNPFMISFSGATLDASNRPSEMGVGAPPDSSYFLTWVRGNLQSTYDIPLIGQRSRHFKYSGEDRLMESEFFDGDGGEYRYAYDANGERVASWRRENDVVREVEFAIRDESGAILTEWRWTDSPTFVRTKDYFYSGRQLAAQLNWVHDVAVFDYIFPDHLGSTRVSRSLTSGPQFIDYFPFGDIREGNVSLVNTDLLFTGHERDVAALDSGLDYMHARYYSPNLGRFLSVDPVGGSIGSSQSWNRYSYVLNSPINATDPTGEFFFLPAIPAAYMWLGAATLTTATLAAPSPADSSKSVADVAVRSTMETIDWIGQPIYMGIPGREGGGWDTSPRPGPRGGTLPRPKAPKLRAAGDSPPGLPPPSPHGPPPKGGGTFVKFIQTSLALNTASANIANQGEEASAPELVSSHDVGSDDWMTERREELKKEKFLKSLYSSKGVRVPSGD